MRLNVTSPRTEQYFDRHCFQIVQNIQPVIHEMRNANTLANRAFAAALLAKMNMRFRYPGTLLKLMMRHPEPGPPLNPWASF